MKIKIKVHPNSSKQEIKKLDDAYEVWTKKKAEDNKANIEVIKMLGKYFRKNVAIISGFTSKNKVVELT